MKQKQMHSHNSILDYVDRKDSSVVFSQRVESELFNKLEDALAKLNVSKSEFLRASIKRFLQEETKR